MDTFNNAERVKGDTLDPHDVPPSPDFGFI